MFTTEQVVKKRHFTVSFLFYSTVHLITAGVSADAGNSMTKQGPEQNQEQQKRLASELATQLCEYINNTHEHKKDRVIVVKEALRAVRPWVIKNVQHIFRIKEWDETQEGEAEYYKNTMVNLVLSFILDCWGTVSEERIPCGDTGMSYIKVTTNSLQEYIQKELFDTFIGNCDSIKRVFHGISVLESHFDWELVNESNRIKSAKHKTETFIGVFIEIIKDMIKNDAAKHHSGDVRKIKTIFNGTVASKIIEVTAKVGFYLNGIMEHLCQEFIPYDSTACETAGSSRLNAQMYKKLYAAATAIRLICMAEPALELFINAIEELDADSNKSLHESQTYVLTKLIAERFELARMFEASDEDTI